MSGGVNTSLDFLNIVVEDTQKSLREKFSDNDVWFLYRGVGELDYANNDAPGLFRYEDGLAKENEIIAKVLNDKPEHFKNCRYMIEKLEILQHYGMPTRLLDVTENFYVALWFACDDALRHIKNKACEANGDKNAYVNVYALSSKKVKYNDSDTVSVLANSALMPANFYVRQKDKKLVDDTFAKKLRNEILKEKPYFLKNILWKHMNKCVVCVKPVRQDERIKAQQGCFLLFGLVDGQKKDTFNLSEKNVQYIWKEKIPIPYSSCESILADLKKLGIDEARLFPDLEHYCGNVKQTLKCKVRTGNWF